MRADSRFDGQASFGVNLDYASSAAIKGCTFTNITGNTGPAERPEYQGAAAIDIQSDATRVERCTFAGNDIDVSLDYGAELQIDNAEVDLQLLPDPICGVSNPAAPTAAADVMVVPAVSVLQSSEAAPAAASPAGTPQAAAAPEGFAPVAAAASEPLGCSRGKVTLLSPGCRSTTVLQKGDRMLRQLRAVRCCMRMRWDLCPLPD